MSDSLVRLLHAAAGVLSEFADPPSSGALRWNGTAYVTNSRSESRFDPYAAKWWATLKVLAGMLEVQEDRLSEGQKDYLDRLLFGGMGSLNDFALDETLLGEPAKNANKESSRLRKEIFAQLRHLQQGAR